MAETKAKKSSRWELEKKNGIDTYGASLAQYVTTIFESFKTARKPFEEIWEECWYNWLGQYNASTTWRSKTEGKQPGKSRIFIKLTALKCNTAHSKIADVLFPANEGIPFDLESVDDALCAQIGISPEQIKDIMHKWKHKLRSYFRRIELQETIDPAILEMAILGTGVLKGPIVEVRKRKTPQIRQVNGMPVGQIDPSMASFEFVESDELVAVIDHIPLWEYYVDPNAKSTKDSIAEIHFQRLLPAHFRKLAYQGGYDAERVFEAARHAKTTDNSDLKYIQLADNYMGESGIKDERISALEFWGQVPAPLLREDGCELPESITDDDIVEALIALGADGITIKRCLNPLPRRGFYVCPYKRRPNCVFGMGVAEMMRDSQKMVNSFSRLLIDNKALSGNGMVAVNIDRINTKRTKNLDVYPGKTWYVKGAYTPKQAIDSITFPDVTMGLKDGIELFERFSDEETGIPKYTSGEQGNFLNKTATGMSMLMGQSNLNIKTVIKNIDDCWIEPIAEAEHDWLMEFDPDEELKIPLSVKATGTDSLIAKELKIEQYMKFMQVTSNPQDAIMMDRVKLMKNVARLLETEDVMRSDDEIKELMKEMSAQANTPKDLREIIDIAKIFPLLAGSEQAQVLQSLGIEPSQQRLALAAPPPEEGARTDNVSPIQQEATATQQPPVQTATAVGTRQ